MKKLHVQNPQKEVCWLDLRTLLHVLKKHEIICPHLDHNPLLNTSIHVQCTVYESCIIIRFTCNFYKQACMINDCRGFIKGRAPGKLTSCEHDFPRLLYISKNVFLIQGTIKNSFKLQSCPFLDKSYRV